MSKKKNKKILLTGGGTGGSVSPLLAVFDELTSPASASLQHPLLVKEREGVRYEFLWIGTRGGVEKEMIKKAGIEFKAITCGKLRRYFSLENLIDPFRIIIGLWQASAIILKWKPDLVMTAGSFVSVPVIWAAWFWGVPTMVHQQDVRPGLANKLMAPFATIVTVAFKKSLDDYGKKAKWTGNPARQSLALGYRVQGTGHSLNLKKDLPVVLIVGGGTGAVVINELVWEVLDELTKVCQAIHITGKHKGVRHPIGCRTPLYQPFDFLEHGELMSVMKRAQVVVSRAGLGILTEIASLGKASIIIPIPGSHQEDNAKVFKEKGAALVLDQEKLTPDRLVNNIKSVLSNEMLRNKLRNNVSLVMKRGANEEMVKIINKMISTNYE